MTKVMVMVMTIFLIIPTLILAAHQEISRLARSAIIPHSGIFVKCCEGNAPSPTLVSTRPYAFKRLDTNNHNLGFPISEVRPNDNRFVTFYTFKINLNRKEGRTEHA